MQSLSGGRGPGRSTALQRSQRAAGQYRKRGQLHLVARSRGLRGEQLAAHSTAVEVQALTGAIEALLQLKQSDGSQEAVDAQLDVVERLSKEAGANKVFAELNDGTFKGYTLQGRTHSLLNSVIPLGQLSFNNYQPAGLLVRPLGSSAAEVFKGARFGRDNAYVISTSFRLEEGRAQGVSHAIATYSPVPGNPQRLEISFQALRLEPQPQQPGDLEEWLAALGGANPGMDQVSGVLEVGLGGALPRGWMDYLAMTSSFQLVAGNNGGKTLLVRSG